MKIKLIKFYSYPVLIYAFGLSIIFISQILTLISIYLCLAAAFIGLLFMLMVSGIEINCTSRKYRLFKSVLGLKKGEWKNIDFFKGIIIRAKSGSKELMGPNLALMPTVRGMSFDIYMVDETHRKKLLIKSFKSKSKGLDFAKKLSSQVNLPFQKYNPKISQATLERKRRRNVNKT